MNHRILTLFLLGSLSAQAVSIVGRQTSATQWTYDLTFAPLDNYSIHQPNTTITISGLCGVTAAGKPASTDFGALNDLNLDWTPQVVNSTTVRWTHVGGGTGNFGEEKHIFGFTVSASGASNGTATLATSGVSQDGATGKNLDITAPVLGPVCLTAGKPNVTAALNSASYASPGALNSGLAQGSLFTAFGTGLGPTQLAVSGFPLQTAFNGTSIKVTVNNVGYDCLLVYTSAAQVAAVLPSTVPAGLGSLVLTYNGQASTPIPVQVVPTSFGSFTLNQSGSGAAIVQNVVSSTELTVNSTTNSARPGQIAILWGTGLGKVTGNEALGPLPGDLTSVPMTLQVGNQLATVQYHGRSGCCGGVDQINFVVPGGTLGCAVPVIVTANNVVSNVTTMSISASGGNCTGAASTPATFDPLPAAPR